MNLATLFEMGAGTAQTAGLAGQPAPAPGVTSGQSGAVGPGSAAAFGNAASFQAGWQAMLGLLPSAHDEAHGEADTHTDSGGESAAGQLREAMDELEGPGLSMTEKSQQNALQGGAGGGSRERSTLESTLESTLGSTAAGGAADPLSGLKNLDNSHVAGSKDLSNSHGAMGAAANGAIRRGGEHESNQIKASPDLKKGSGVDGFPIGDIAALQAAQLAMAAPATAAKPAELPTALREKAEDAVGAVKSHLAGLDPRGLADGEAVPRFEGAQAAGTRAVTAEGTDGTYDGPSGVAAPKAGVQADTPSTLREEKASSTRIEVARRGPSADAASLQGAGPGHGSGNDLTAQVSEVRGNHEPHAVSPNAAAEARPEKGGNQPSAKPDPASHRGAAAAAEGTGQIAPAGQVAPTVDSRLVGTAAVHGASANAALRTSDAAHEGTQTSGESDAFAAMNSAAPATTWIHAGARHAEAGYLDPTLGWVAVRAEANGNMLHAAIVPGSTEAAQTLGGHLAGLNSYLAEHHGQAASLTMATPEDRQNGGALSQQMSGREQDQAGGDASGKSGAETRSTGAGGLGSFERLPVHTDAIQPARWSGGHISVIA